MGDDSERVQLFERALYLGAMSAIVADGAFVYGAFVGAPWPGALAACGMATSGAVTVALMLRRSRA